MSNDIRRNGRRKTREKRMEKTKLIAIKDFQDHGKSTTIWLLVFTLVKQLKAEIVRLYNQNEEKEINELPETIPIGDEMYDIYAELRWNGLLLILIGRGDFADKLVEDIRWALDFRPDYIVCSIQMRPVNRDIWNAFDNAYPNTQYSRVSFWTENTIDPTRILEVKEPTIEAILRYIQPKARIMLPYHMYNMTNGVHHRVVFPVGHGYFAFEKINNTTVIYDCGSKSAPQRVEFYINELVNHGINHIDYLYISHFDVDHVNGLAYLLRHIHVNRAIMPRIPEDYKHVYDLATSSTYTQMINVLREYRTEINYVDAEEGSRYAVQNANHVDIWEWRSKSMLQPQDWNILDGKLQNRHVDVNRLNDPGYLELHKSAINKAFKDAFGPQGPNSKGLMMLSHELVNVAATIYHGVYSPIYIPNLFPTAACLYTGDCYLKGNNLIDTIQFVSRYHNKELLLLQIPHHGSKYSSDRTLLNIGSVFKYVCDKSKLRYGKNELVHFIQPLFVREGTNELLFTETQY